MIPDSGQGRIKMEMREENPWALEVEDLTVAYDIEPVLWDVDLDIP